MAPGLLQVYHHGGKLFIGHFRTAAFMADVKVLAENTKQVAVGKEYGAGAVSSNQWGFLAKMRVIAGNPCASPGFTYPERFRTHAIDPAFPWTERTGF
jgi:hypothetical protein